MFFYICSTCFLRFTGQHMYSTSIKDLDTAHDDPAFVLPGADINVRNRAGQKALHIAKSSLGSPSWNVTGALCWKHVETIGFSIRKRWKNGDWTNINMVSWEYQINESASRHVFSLIVFPPQIETWPRMLLQRSELIQVLTHGVPRAVLSGAWCGAWCGAVTWGSHGKNHPKKWWGSIFNKDVYRLSYLYTHT